MNSTLGEAQTATDDTNNELAHLGVMFIQPEIPHASNAARIRTHAQIPDSIRIAGRREDEAAREGKVTHTLVEFT